MNTTTRTAEIRALSRLLDRGLELEADALDAWLDGLADEDRRHAPRLRELLAGHLRATAAAFMAAGPRLDSTPDEAALTPGERVGPYRLVREIGRGGMSVVWLAERPGDGVRVAVKLATGRATADAAGRMERERAIGALMRHPQVATLVDAGSGANQRPYLVLDYIDGQALDVWCKDRRLDLADRLRVFLQVTRAVAYVHGRGVVHRDMKPSNVLVTADGQAHVIDFGIAARASPPASTQPAADTLRSLTPGYASPEQRRGEVTTVASDVYSLGVMLFELVTGRLPCEALPGSEGVAGRLGAILRMALAEAPEQRHATAAALADQIEDWLSGPEAAGPAGRRSKHRLQTGQRDGRCPGRDAFRPRSARRSGERHPR